MLREKLRSNEGKSKEYSKEECVLKTMHVESRLKKGCLNHCLEEMFCE